MYRSSNTTSRSSKTVRLHGLFADGVWKCNCNPRLPADHFQTKNGGRHHGRWFYVCQKPKNTRCDFWLWDDEAKPREAKAVLNNSRTEPTTPKRNNPLNIHTENAALSPSGGKSALDRQRLPASARKQAALAFASTDAKQSQTSRAQHRHSASPKDEFDLSSGEEADLAAVTDAARPSQAQHGQPSTPTKEHFMPAPITPVSRGKRRREESEKTAEESDTLAGHNIYEEDGVWQTALDLIQTDQTFNSSAGLMSPVDTPTLMRTAHRDNIAAQPPPLYPTLPEATPSKAAPSKKGLGPTALSQAASASALSEALISTQAPSQAEESSEQPLPSSSVPFAVSSPSAGISVADSALASDLITALQQHLSGPLTSEAISTIKTISATHARKLQGIERGRDVVRGLIRREQEENATLREKVRILEMDRALLKDVVRQLRLGQRDD